MQLVFQEWFTRTWQKNKYFVYKNRNLARTEQNVRCNRIEVLNKAIRGIFLY